MMSLSLTRKNTEPSFELRIGLFTQGRDGPHYKYSLAGYTYAALSNIRFYISYLGYPVMAGDGGWHISYLSLFLHNRSLKCENFTLECV